MRYGIVWLVGGLGCVGVLALLAGGSTGSPARTEEKPAGRAEVPEDDGKLRILCFGAHPDDCELKAIERAQADVCQ